MLIRTGVVERHFLQDHAAVVFQLSAQLRLVFPQLLLTAGRERGEIKNAFGAIPCFSFFVLKKKKEA